MTKLFKLLFFIVFSSCHPPIDYFGNSFNSDEEQLFLSDVGNDSTKEHLYHLTFILKKNKGKIDTSDYLIKSYLKLVMNYFGYSEMAIIDHKEKGIIQPRLYITVKFD